MYVGLFWLSCCQTHRVAWEPVWSAPCQLLSTLKSHDQGQPIAAQPGPAVQLGVYTVYMSFWPLYSTIYKKLPLDGVKVYTNFLTWKLWHSLQHHFKDFGVNSRVIKQKCCAAHACQGISICILVEKNIFLDRINRLLLCFVYEIC